MFKKRQYFVFTNSVLQQTSTNKIYGVSHETGELVNSFECLLPFTTSAVIRHFAVYLVLIKILTQINQFYSNMIAIRNIFYYSPWYEKT